MGTRKDIAVEAAQLGADVAQRLFETNLSVDTKESRLDYVTNADTEAQKRIVKKISNAYPDDVIVGEEEDERKTIPNSGEYWVIDPIDGTTNYVLGTPIWATSVATVSEGTTVAAVTITPALSNTYVAGTTTTSRNGDRISVSDRDTVEAFTAASILRYGQDQDDEFASLMRALLLECGDLRRFGSAQATLAMVASGSLDATAAIQPNPNAWDTIAGVHLVRQAGGTVTDIHGNPWGPTSEGLVASNGNAHEQLITSLHRSLDR